ncbi:MAG: helix-turn-helix transcriptional regulator [Alphaproteobacteria bacterium]|nr:helix-turn-helix transcriptional regulator [Alphaproteobacteria bacterium]
MAKTPKPGKPVRGSTTGRPIMALFDLLGRRWTGRVIWELREGRQPTFRALREFCGNPSPSVLNTRLAELREAGLVEAIEGGGYRLTEIGRRLLKVLIPLHLWADDWAAGLSRDSLSNRR